jgi:hypothetical protein
MAGTENHLARYIRYALIVLGGVLLLLFIFLIVQYRTLRYEQVLNAREVRSAVLQHHAPLSASDADDIRSWMTFDYINKVFAMPPSYLENQLQIVDPRYPRLSLSSYAKSKNIASADFLIEVESAIREYVPPQNSSGTASSTTTR